MARLAHRRLLAAGIATEPLLERAGLTPEEIGDPQRRLQVSHEARFMDLAEKALGDDMLGIHLAQVAELREIGPLYHLFTSSENLVDAFERIARFSSVVNEGIVLEKLGGSHLGMSFRHAGTNHDRDHHLIEFGMTALARVCQHVTGRHLLPSRTRFTHSRKGHSQELATIFGANIHLGAPVDDIVFPEGAGRLLVTSADPWLNRLLVSYCEETLSHCPTAHDSFRSEVEHAIVPLLPHGKAKVAEIASRLGVSSRTFARRLESEELSFSYLLENLRSQLAERYLGDEKLSISEVSWLLGYQEISAFSRAYKRWTGKTPREARLAR
ncbi:MAG TPA: AraC family transcriptional regulator [Rhizomicrobium sp.]|nr:AraC family transcriptional regulator [Rhizomicrobium sp.]